MLPFQLLIAALAGWLQREQADVISFLREENRLLKGRLAGQRLRFDDGERRRLAELGHRLIRRLLGQVATLVTPDTIRWHRELVARKWTYRAGRVRPAGLQARSRALVIRMVGQAAVGRRSISAQSAGDATAAACPAPRSWRSPEDRPAHSVRTGGQPAAIVVSQAQPPGPKLTPQEPIFSIK